MESKKKKVPRAIGMAAFQKMSFETLDFDGDWRAHIGEPAKNFKMFVDGHSGQGKTDYVVQFVKYISRFGKVYYNSHEEGPSKTLQEAFSRHNLWEMEGKIVLGNKEPWDIVMTRMGRKNSPRFCVIDSLDYMELTVDQYKEFDNNLKHKSIIIISWSEGKHPKTSAGKAIKYMCDIKVRVHDKKAHIVSRYGGVEPFIVWPEYWAKKAAEAEAKAANETPAKRSRPALQKPPSAPAAAPSLFTAEPEPEPDKPDELDGFFNQRSYY